MWHPPVLSRGAERDSHLPVLKESGLVKMNPQFYYETRKVNGSFPSSEFRSSDGYIYYMTDKETNALLVLVRAM